MTTPSRIRPGRPTGAPQTEVQRFMARVAPPDEHGCMQWLGPCSVRGAALFTNVRLPDGNVGAMTARVYLWWKLHGEMPTRKLTTNCDNPLCLTPEHVILSQPKAVPHWERSWRAVFDSLPELRRFFAYEGGHFHRAMEFGLTVKQAQILHGGVGRQRLLELESLDRGVPAG